MKAKGFGRTLNEEKSEKVKEQEVIIYLASFTINSQNFLFNPRIDNLEAIATP